MLIIIGSGLAGYRLATEWRKHDTKTPLTLITESNGDFYSKPLLSTALTQKKTAEGLVITPSERMAEQLNAQIITHTVVDSLDLEKKRILFQKGYLAYDQLVLACGSTPIALSLQGDAACEVMSVNDLEAYAIFRRRLTPDKRHVAILGSGLVGCEFANDLLNIGVSLDMISLEAYPLAKFVPEIIGRVLQQAFSEKGVRWHFKVAAEAVTWVDHCYQLQLSNGRTLVVDAVLSAVGLLANTRLAREAGLSVSSGINVNRRLQTSDPSVYALGDCAAVSGQLKQYVAPLLLCAQTLAKVLVGEDPVVEYPPMPIVIKTPTCPVAVCPVPLGVLGEWQYQGEGRHKSALFYDERDQLRGFALTGDCVRDRFELVKRLPPVF